MDRRTFLSWVGLGWIASSLPIAIAACSSNSSEQPKPTGTAPVAGNPNRQDGFQPVATIAELDQAGYLLNENSAIGALEVIRNPANSKDLIAVNPTCTHKGCMVKWQANAKVFVCPCHDSQFSPDGSVVKGPATKPLPTYLTKVEGNSIFVKQRSV